MQQTESTEDMHNIAQDAYDLRERIRRKTNVVLSGLIIDSDDPQQLTDIVQEFFEVELQVNVKVVCVERKVDNIFIVKLGSVEDKVRVLKKKYAMVDKRARVSVYSDHSPRERKMYEVLKSRLGEEKQKGSLVRFGYRGLVINGENWLWSDRRQELFKVVCSGHHHHARHRYTFNFQITVYNALPPAVRPADDEVESTHVYNERKRNLIITGVLLETNDPLEWIDRMEHFFALQLEVPAVVQNVTKATGDTCIVKLSSVETKADILENKWKLRGLNIHIHSDSTSLEQAVQHKIAIIGNQLIRFGNTVHIGFMRLIVNGRQFVWDDATQQLWSADGQQLNCFQENGPFYINGIYGRKTPYRNTQSAPFSNLTEFGTPFPETYPSNVSLA